MSLDVVAAPLSWPAISRALARHDPSTALTLLRERLPNEWAGRALLELTRSQHGWPTGGYGDMTEPLRDRELQTLRCAARGLSIEGTARELFLSPHTVRSHRKRVYEKLGVHSVQAAIAAGHERGLLD